MKLDDDDINVRLVFFIIAIIVFGTVYLIFAH